MIHADTPQSGAYSGRQKETAQAEHCLTVAVIFSGVTVFVFWLYLLSCTALYSDDFYYATFWKGGIKNYIDMSVDHFKTFNGRVLVHALVQAVLAFPKPVFDLVNTLSLLLLGFLGMRLQHKAMPAVSALAGMCLFALQLMLIGSPVLRESLLWASGSYNYMIPVLLGVLACLLTRYRLQSKRRFILIWFIPLQFLLGATTEQCGVFTIVSTFCISLHWFVRESSGVKGFARVLLAPALNLLGYITIFLSPATMLRAETHSSLALPDLLVFLPRWADSFLNRDGILPLLFIFCIAAAVYGLINRKKLWPLILGVPVALLLASSISSGRKDLAFIVFLAYLALTALLLIFNSPMGAGGSLLAGGAAAALVMLPTNTFEPRTTLPLALVLALASAFFIIRSAAALWEEKKPLLSAAPAIALILVTVVCVQCFFPVVGGYQDNHMIDEENEANIKEAQSTGELEYLIDYDMEFSHLRPFADGYFMKYFLELNDISGCKVYFDSTIYPSVYVGEERMSYPAYKLDGKHIFPVAQTIRTLGGEVVWTREKTEYTVGDRHVTLRENILYLDPESEASINITGQWSLEYGSQFFTREIMERAFGITFDYDEIKNNYYAKLL